MGVEEYKNKPCRETVVGNKKPLFMGGFFM